MTPLVLRAVSILRRRGEIPALRVDGRLVDLQYRSPLARQQARQEAQSTLLWLESVTALGPEALGVVDLPAAARALGRALGVPADLVRPEAAGEGAP